MSVTITELVQTCVACPAQWEGETSDGLHVYIRYRGGHLSAVAAPTLDSAVSPQLSDDDAVVLVSKDVGGWLDGTMSEQEMRGHLMDAGVKFNYA